MAQVTTFYATGRRKTSAARVFLKSGSGQIVVNGLKYGDYLHRESSRMLVIQPLEVTNLMGKFDINATVCGGGESGQAGALRHALTRALVNFDAELKPVFKKFGYLTRDSRMVERKKYGQHKARKNTQYSKR